MSTPFFQAGPLRSVCIPLLLALIASASLLMSCSRTPAQAIEHVLNECVQISNGASGVQGDPAKAGYIADHMQALDTSDCPPEFRAAFQDHVNAWRQAQIAYGNNSIANNVVLGAVAAITDNASSLGSNIGAAFEAQQEVNTTYYRLANIAVAQGARVPRPVVQ